MARLIDVDYVLSALGIFNDRENGNEHFLNGIETAVEVIENAPTVSDWISIEDRLPEETGWYIVYAPGYSEEFFSGLGNHNDVLFAKWSGKAWSIVLDATPSAARGGDRGCLTGRKLSRGWKRALRQK